MMTVDQILADNRKMERFICDRLRTERTRIVLAGGWAPAGPAWVDLTLLLCDDGDHELIIESNEPDAFRVREVYEHFRRQERTTWEREREIRGEINHWKVHELEKVMAVLGEKMDRRSSPDAHSEDVDGYELPKEVSTAQAARILGVSRDTVLKLKEAGLLEYRNLAPPTSIRAVFRFLLTSVLELRNDYRTDFPAPPSLPQPQRRRVRQRQEPKYKHLRVD